MNNDFEYEKDHVTKKGNTVHFKISFSKLAFGLLFIAFAVFLILDSLGVSFGVLSTLPAWVLILSVLNIAWLIDRIVKLKISEIFFPIAFLFMLLESHIARWCNLKNENIIDNGIVFLCAFLLMLGVSFLTPKGRIRIKNGKKLYYHSGVHRKNSGSASTIYVDCENSEDDVLIKNELGSCNVYFSNVDSYNGNITMNVHNELGSMTIHVPSEWRISTNISNELGSVSEPDDSGKGDKLLRINGHNELGSLRITRV